MTTLTLDTNALQDLAWLLGKSPERRYAGDQRGEQEARDAFETILSLRDRGLVELGVTTRLYTDFWKTHSELPPHLADLLGEYVDVALPSIFSLPLVLPAVLPDENEYEKLFADVFPSSEPTHRSYRRNCADAWQLYAQRVARRDFFITTDRGILNRGSILATRWSITVMSPRQFVEAFTVHCAAHNLG